MGKVRGFPKVVRLFLVDSIHIDPCGSSDGNCKSLFPYHCWCECTQRFWLLALDQQSCQNPGLKQLIRKCWQAIFISLPAGSQTSIPLIDKFVCFVIFNPASMHNRDPKLKPKKYCWWKFPICIAFFRRTAEIPAKLATKSK